MAIRAIELDTSGDAILELSSHSSEKTYHLVSPKVLILLSLVLGKMFDWEARSRADDEEMSHNACDSAAG